MESDIAGQIYGSGPLTDAYRHIDELGKIGTQMQRVLKAQDVTDPSTREVLDFEYDDLHDLRMASMDAIEDHLLEASDSANGPRPMYDSMSVFLGYTAYLGVIHPELSEPAERLALNGMSLIQGVPVITRAYSYPQAGVVQSKSPSMAIRYDGQDTHRLGVYDDTEIFFSGEVIIMKSGGIETPLTLDKRELANMIVGSSAVNSFLTYLESNRSDRILHGLSLSFASLYKPNEAALQDDLVGTLDLNLA